MVIEQGVVVVAEGDYVLLSIPHKHSCDQCQSSGGCGLSLFARMAGQKEGQIRVKNTLAVKVGDKVQVGVSGQSLIQLSFMTYLAPLLSMFGLVHLAKLFWVDIHELVLVLLALAGLLLGLLLVRKWVASKMSDSRLHPHIIRVDSDLI